MIIVVESVKGNSGKGVPMYSRTGKQTINQFLAFAAKSSPRDKQVTGKRFVLILLLTLLVNR
jgi:hypothetical protein